MAHLLPHTHAQTNHGAPAVHRDHATLDLVFKLTRVALLHTTNTSPQQGTIIRLATSKEF